MTPDRCLVCGSADFTTVFSYDSPDDYEIAVDVPPQNYARQWVRCDTCGFHYSQYSRPPEILDRLYAEGYRDTGANWRSSSTEETFKRIIDLPDDESESKARSFWIKTEIKNAIAAGILDWPAAPWNMTDIGGATGVFAYAFKDREWTCGIIDPAPEGRFIEKHGIAYQCASYRPGLLENTHLATLVFTLEHMRDPIAVLTALRDDLSSSHGVVFIEVPDALAFEKKPADDDIFNSCHLWMFDPASMVALLTKCGLEVVTLRRTRTLRGHYSLMLIAKAAS